MYVVIKTLFYYFTLPFFFKLKTFVLQSVILIYMYIFVEQITGTRRCIVLIFFK